MQYPLTKFSLSKAIDNCLRIEVQSSARAFGKYFELEVNKESAEKYFKDHLDTEWAITEFVNERINFIWRCPRTKWIHAEFNTNNLKLTIYLY